MENTDNDSESSTEMKDNLNGHGSDGEESGDSDVQNGQHDNDSEDSKSDDENSFTNGKAKTVEINGVESDSESLENNEKAKGEEDEEMSSMSEAEDVVVKKKSTNKSKPIDQVTKKRGRPSKNSTGSKNPPKQRGRPKKKKLESDSSSNEEEASDSEDDTKKKASNKATKRLKKMIGSDDDDDTSEDEEALFTKSQKKQVESEDLGEKKSDRMKKEKKYEEEDESHDSDEMSDFDPNEVVPVEDVEEINIVLDHRIGKVGATGEQTMFWSAKNEGDPNITLITEETEEQFLIKWMGWSHLNNTWESEETIESKKNVKGIKKLYNYQQKLNEFNSWKRHAHPEDVEYQEMDIEMGRQLLTTHVQVGCRCCFQHYLPRF